LGGGNAWRTKSAEDQKRKNRELLLRIMICGVQMHMWAMQSLATKARAFLAVGAIVASILIAGLGSAVGLLVGDNDVRELLAGLPSWAFFILASCGFASIASILLSIHFSLRALRTTTVSMIGFQRFTRDGTNMDWEKLAEWINLTEDEIYKYVHHLFFVAMRSLMKDNSNMAKYADRGKNFLLVGLCLGFAFAVTALSLSFTLGVP